MEGKSAIVMHYLHLKIPLGISWMMKKNLFSFTEKVSPNKKIRKRAYLQSEPSLLKKYVYHYEHIYTSHFLSILRFLYEKENQIT